MNTREMVTAMCNEIDKVNFILSSTQQHAGRISLTENDDAALEECINVINGYLPQLIKADIASVYESCNHEEYINYLHQVSDYISEVEGVVSRSKSNKWFDAHAYAV